MQLFDMQIFDMQIFDIIGFEGPYIMFWLTLVFIWREYKYFIAYIIGWYLDSYLNKILKNEIHQPRPSISKNLSDLDNIKNYHGSNQYGMPSGHAQSIFFSICYLFLVKKSKILLIITLFIALLTLYQRWIYGRHTIEQLFVGSIIGISFSYLWYRLVKMIIHNTTSKL